MPDSKCIISVDYDGTFSKCPFLFGQLIEEAVFQGHIVLCVSARIDKPESRKEIQNAMPEGVIVYLTNHNPKKEWIERRGISVDIWIEDNPLALFESDAPEKQIKDELALLNGAPL